MYPRYWETYHSVNAYDQAFLADGSPNPQRNIKTQSNNLESVADPQIDAMIDQYRASSDKQEMIDLAHTLDQALFDYASFSPGFKQSYFRIGYWRWIKHPDGFSQKHSSNSSQFFTYWIDQDAKKANRDARNSSATFKPEITVFDQYRQNGTDDKSGS